jgi:hypothetical protein
MSVGSFVSNPTTTVGAGLLDNGGSQTLLVGATLAVTAAQPAGTYKDDTGFMVTVNYN